ncbi:ABC transporter permease [Pontiella sulfatireligans]|uniref:Lipoprotein-releasing system transmembrane protein LolE n=1 Tax=Pontiella sulfatireligans TaxID=2750658 RepID=A0A6C2UR85_9BACT|nr:ABC transporter permease [Pontiella sulfatireligans]VGO22832.1 Lipoprotein-releasing system transmembrane protein LolE [Pontiella sulfatireligans]
MKLPFSLFLAFKYLKPKRSFISAVTVISMLGVTIGVAVLIVVLSVMTGFDEVWRDKILGFNAHISLVQQGGIVRNPAYVLEKMAQIEGVKGVAPSLEGLVLIQVDERVHTPILRGVDPEYEDSVSQVPSHIIAGEFSVEDDQIVVGRDLANRLDIWVGDKLTVYSPQSFIAEDEIRLPEELTVSGIFHVGMYEYDVGFAFTSLETARSLYDVEQGVHSIQVMLDDPMMAAPVAAQIHGILGRGYFPRTWMEMHSQIFAALHVEKNMMFFLLAFVALVAAFSITNTLITLTVQKTREIGLLKSLGFGNGGITGVFFWMGLIQGVVGNALGVGLAMLVLKYRNELLVFMSREFNLELLPPELYQLSKLPAHTTGTDVAIVCTLVLFFCTIAGFVPAMRAAKMEPVDALRYE